MPRDSSPAAPTPRPAPEPDDSTDAPLPFDDPERYEQVAEHGRGGLGRVVRAIDRRLGRTVAVKELLRHEESHEQRFMREARITARLEHPGIVPVHEAGRWPNGAPYYVMKLVEGRTLKELLAQTPALAGRLGLLSHVIAVADAVGYAHSEGVIHRDLKPSNVIVGSFGETVVIDWGLARDCREGVPEPTGEARTALGSGVTTISGKVIGTPAYMAPEQARGEEVDARADVYAIGCVLYELLSGKAPHTDETPQAVLDRVIAGPPAPLERIAPHAPAELIGIVRKAMARHPGDRYVNATALAEDLRRFTAGKLVSAHAYTPWQLIRRKVAQHRGVVALAAASVIALGAVGIESFRSVVTQRDIARGERARAEDRERELVLVQARTSLPRDPTATLAWLKQFSAGERELPEVVDLIDEATAAGVARHVFRPGTWVYDAQFTPDGRSVVSIERDGSLHEYDLASGRTRALGTLPSPGDMLAISPDGATAIAGGILGEVVAFPLAGGEPRTLVESGRPVTGLRVDRAGKRVVVERAFGPSDLVELSGNAQPIGGAKTLHVAVAADDWSRRVALAAPNQVVALEGDVERPVAHTDHAISYLALSPDARTVVLQEGDAVWAAPYAGGKLAKLVDFAGKLNGVVWSPDRSLLAVVGRRPDVPVVHLATGEVDTLRGHTDAIYNAEFTRDGATLLTASDDGTARLWNLRDGSSRVLRGHDDDVYRAHLSPDERSAVTASLDGSVRVWTLAQGDSRPLVAGAPVEDLRMAGGTLLVHTPGALDRWDVAAGTHESLFAWKRDPKGLGKGVASPDGERLLVPQADYTIEVRSRSGAPVVLRGHRALISEMQWSRDGNYVFTSSYDGTLRRWDAATGAGTVLVSGDKPVRAVTVAADGRVAAQVGETAVLVAPDGHVQTLGEGRTWCAAMEAFEPVRDRLVIQRCDRGVTIVDGERVIELPTENTGTTRMAASPDGSRFAAGMDDRSVRVWDARTGKVLQVLEGHSDLVLDVAFSPDGAQLASSSYDRTIRVWQLATGRHRVLRGHTGPVNRIAWTGNTSLVSGSDDGTLRVWQAPPAELPTRTEIAQWLAAATTATIDAHNRATSTSRS